MKKFVSMTVASALSVAMATSAFANGAGTYNVNGYDIEVKEVTEDTKKTDVIPTYAGPDTGADVEPEYSEQFLNFWNAFDTEDDYNYFLYRVTGQSEDNWLYIGNEEGYEYGYYDYEEYGYGTGYYLDEINWSNDDGQYKWYGTYGDIFDPDYTDYYVASAKKHYRDCSPYVPDRSGKFVMNSTNVGETLSAKNLETATVGAGNQMMNLYDDRGDWITNATMSSDGHVVFVPCSDGTMQTIEAPVKPFKSQQEAEDAYVAAVKAYQAQSAAQNAAYIAAVNAAK